VPIFRTPTLWKHRCRKIYPQRLRILSESSLLRRSSADGRLIGDDRLLRAFVPAIGARLSIPIGNTPAECLAVRAGAPGAQAIVKPCQTVFVEPAHSRRADDIAKTGPEPGLGGREQWVAQHRGNGSERAADGEWGPSASALGAGPAILPKA